LRLLNAEDTASRKNERAQSKTLPSSQNKMNQVTAYKYDRSHRRRKVAFGHIEVYEHSYEMGDNPCVSDGVPLTIGWELQSKHAFDIAYFETYFPSEERRKKASMRLGVTERAKILLRQGYTVDEIAECTLKVMQEKRLQDKSIKNIKWDRWNALLEKTTRKLNKATRRRRRSSLDHFNKECKAVPLPPPPPPMLGAPASPEKQHRGRRPRRVSLGPSGGAPSPEWVPFSPLKSPTIKKKIRVEPKEEEQGKKVTAHDGTHLCHFENLPPLDAFIQDAEHGNSKRRTNEKARNNKD
jgi:hypothetical protein